jgi:hypothetical protein
MCQQQCVQPVPHSGLLPLIQPPPAGVTRSISELLRQMHPRHPRVQHKQNARQRLTIRQPLAAGIPHPPRLAWQQRLDQLPQLVRHNPRRTRRHRHPSKLDDGCRRASSPGNRSLHSAISSKKHPCHRTCCSSATGTCSVWMTCKPQNVILQRSRESFVRTIRTSSQLALARPGSSKPRHIPHLRILSVGAIPAHRSPGGANHGLARALAIE